MMAGLWISTIHSSSLPPELSTSRCKYTCGFTHSNVLTAPSIVVGFSILNIDVEWWADASCHQAANNKMRSFILVFIGSLATSPQPALDRGSARGQTASWDHPHAVTSHEAQGSMCQAASRCAPLSRLQRASFRQAPPEHSHSPPARAKRAVRRGLLDLIRRPRRFLRWSLQSSTRRRLSCLYY